MLASDKCHELAIALYSLAKKVSYDDVQAAVTYLSQCASNVLSVRSQSICKSLILYCLSLRAPMDRCKNARVFWIWTGLVPIHFQRITRLISIWTGQIYVTSVTSLGCISIGCV